MSPGFSDKPPYNNVHLGEGDPEVDDPPPPLGESEQLLVGVVPGGAGTLHHPRASRPAPLLISYNAAARLASRLPLRRDELRECGGLRNRPQFAQELSEPTSSSNV